MRDQAGKRSMKARGGRKLSSDWFLQIGSGLGKHLTAGVSLQADLNTA